MKILYVNHGHFWGSTWPYAYIDSYIVETLKKMGHEIRFFDFYSRAFLFHQSLKEVRQVNNLSKDQYLKLVEERASCDLPLEVLEFEPDFILHIVGRLSTRSLQAVRKIKVPTVIWFLDDPQELKTTTHKARFYDHVFTVEPRAVAAYQKAGIENVYYLPLGCFPDIQKSQEVSDRYRSDICFVGVPFPNRVELFDKLADVLKNYKIKIIGGGQTVGGEDRGGWFWEKQLKRMDVYKGCLVDQVIPPEEAAKYYNGAKINLNIHRTSSDQRFEQDENLGITANGVNGRTFEIAACQGFQIIDNTRNVSEFFEEGKEIVIYKDEKDLAEKIRHFLTNEKERKQIAQNGYNKVINNNTYQHRLQVIINSLNSDNLSL